MDAKKDIKLLCVSIIIYEILAAVFTSVEVSNNLSGVFILSMLLRMGIRLFCSLGFMYGIYNGSDGIRKLYLFLSGLGIVSGLHYILTSNKLLLPLLGLAISIQVFYTLTRPHVVGHTRLSGGL